MASARSSHPPLQHPQGFRGLWCRRHRSWESYPRWTGCTVGRITASRDPESGLDRYTGAVLVAEWMTRDPITHAPEDSMGQAAETMSRRQIRRIPVIEHGAVIGNVAKS